MLTHRDSFILHVKKKYPMSWETVGKKSPYSNDQLDFVFYITRFESWFMGFRTLWWWSHFWNISRYSIDFVGCKRFSMVSSKEHNFLWKSCFFVYSPVKYSKWWPLISWIFSNSSPSVFSIWNHKQIKEKFVNKMGSKMQNFLRWHKKKTKTLKHHESKRRVQHVWWSNKKSQPKSNFQIRPKS